MQKTSRSKIFLFLAITCSLDFNQNALPETESPRFDQIPQAIDGVPPLHTPEGASNVPEQAEGELEAVAAEVAEDPTVKRKRTRKSRINDLLTSPIVPYVDGDIDLHSEATPVKRVRKPRKRKRQTGNEDPADISGGIFENSERVEVLRDADTGTRRSSRIQGRMSATPLLQNEAQLPEIAEDHIISPLRNPFQTSQPLLSPHLQLPEIGMLRTPSLLGAVVGVTSRSSLADFAANFSHVSSHNENALEDVETGQHEALVIRDFKKTNRATTFGQMLSSCTDRRSAMERFMGLMRLAKTKVLDVKQVAYMGTIEVDAGARFNTMMSH
ncbi:hypothetical protein QR680_004822 [Steinernema hermaphroditum]|uniref:Rad21/Rec8-like protein C-terminal eukaryotic domain-containing protein n=1 Tax=Steinernema hermaphroditum TaxID=289476 RepID=A0AA39LUL4_9BILA|nr:hypothetical protein QR680_004822 [Steinernema hermaphroditum]